MAARRSSLVHSLLGLAEDNDNDPEQLSKVDQLPKNQRQDERRRSSLLTEARINYAKEQMALRINSGTPPTERERGIKQDGAQNGTLKGWPLLSKEMKQIRNMKAHSANSKKSETTAGSTRTGSPGSIVRTDGASSAGSQALGKSNKLEDQINMQHLVELMRIFHEADENGSDGLDIDEFRASFGQILGNEKNDQQMAIMFMKIDTNCDGNVDWDEFCTYMLLEYQEKEVMAGEKLLPFPYPMKILNSPTHAMVTKITYLPVLQRHGLSNSLMSETQPGSSSAGDTSDQSSHLTSTTAQDGRFLSVTKDGTLCFWKSNLTLQRAITLDCGKSKRSWVSDLVVLPNINKMIVSYTDCMLALYDLATASCDNHVQIVGLPSAVVQMYYWVDPKLVNHAVLVLGDTGGGVIILEFSDITSSLFCSSASHLKSQRITFSELRHYKQDGLKMTYKPKLHSDWVCQVKYCPSVSYVMSSSCDDNNSLYLADLHGQNLDSVMKVRKGVIAFDYCNEWNIIATGGLDRIVRYWNPYVTGKPIAVLRGHSSAVLNIAINSAQGLVLSLSKDFSLRVWSIEHQLCVQNCRRCQPLLPHPPAAFYLHQRTGSILVGTDEIAALESSQYEEQIVRGADIMSHKQPLCAALYNENFNQVVSGCHGSVVSVWDIDTGEKTIQFSRCHSMMEITAMAFDPTGRRLITGSKDGSIKIWNFNNGACLSVLESSYTAEVTSISFMNQRIVAGGWSRCLAVYGDTRHSNDIIPKYWAVGVHKDDILCTAYQEPNTLASASYDGNIVVWNLDLERPICKMNRRNFCLKRDKTTGHSEFHSKEHAIEKILFLKSRDQRNQSSATLIACGAGGFVQMWNHNGGEGLIGEFNIWDNSRHTIPEDKQRLECITSMKVDSKDSLLITGNSIGYVQMWKIAEYCVDVPKTQRPIRTPPEITTAWRGHLTSIVSIDLAEGKGLLITASTDCSVRVWALNGRYIGTFGEKTLWKLKYPIKQAKLPIKIPPAGINRIASFKTLRTISGPRPSKWKVARNLFKLLRQAKQIQEALRMFGIKVGGIDGEQRFGVNILGKCYERKSRFREPIVPKKLKLAEGKVVGLYHTLHCHDMAVIEQDQASSDEADGSSETCKFSDPCNLYQEQESVSSIKQPHTEHSLFHDSC